MLFANSPLRGASPLALTTVLLLAGICLLCASSASARHTKDPIFDDLTAPTSSVPAPAVRVAALATNPVSQPSPAPVATPAPDAGPSPAAQAKGKTLYSFQASDLELKAALAAFARANDLNIVPDNDVTGTVTLDVRNLPLDQMMRALLEASDCSWQEAGGLIRVHSTETRIFYVDYLRLSRNGQGRNSATLSSATTGGSSGGATGGSAAGGGGGGSAGSSSINLIADNEVDFWREAKTEMEVMLTPAGRSSLAINKTAGIIQVTDRPSALKRVAAYLDGVDQSVHRQVDIEAKLYDVTLNDQFQFGIDWVHVAEAYGGGLGFGAATLPIATGGSQLQDSALAGLNHIIGGANPFTMVFTNFNTSAAINALKQQGNVEVISKPRIRTLNNQTALIKVGTENPFFAQFLQSQQSQSGNITTSGDQITTITVGAILSITPQVSRDDYVSLDISPVLTSLIDTKTSPSKTATAPVLDTKQASTLVRVRDGNTIVMGGLIQTEEAKNEAKIPLLGDIPLLGKLFTGTFHHHQKRELVIFVTPHIIRDGAEVSLSTPSQNSSAN